MLNFVCIIAKKFKTGNKACFFNYAFHVEFYFVQNMLFHKSDVIHNCKSIT